MHNVTHEKLLWWRRLRYYFDKAVRHAKLSNAARVTAWESAQASPKHAYTVYRAIARSLA